MDETQGNHGYNVVLGCDLFSELKKDLFLLNNKIRINGCVYKGRTDPMKEASKINSHASSDWLKDKRLWNE